MVLCPALVSEKQRFPAAGAGGAHHRRRRSDFSGHDGDDTPANSTTKRVERYAHDTQTNRSGAAIVASSVPGVAGPPRSTTPRRDRGSGAVEEGKEGGQEGERVISASSSAAAAASRTHEQFLLYFLRLMDSFRVAEKKYVVLLCGGGGGGGGDGDVGRGSWLSWARFSFLGQVHSLLPRRCVRDLHRGRGLEEESHGHCMYIDLDPHELPQVIFCFRLGKNIFVGVYFQLGGAQLKDAGRAHGRGSLGTILARCSMVVLRVASSTKNPFFFTHRAGKACHGWKL